MRIRFVRPADDRATDQGMPARQWPMKRKRDGPQTLLLQTRRICPGGHFPCAAVMIAARGTDGLQTRRWRGVVWTPSAGQGRFWLGTVMPVAGLCPACSRGNAAGLDGLSASRSSHLDFALDAHRHCQLGRPWYARSVGGAAARLGSPLLTYCDAPL